MDKIKSKVFQVEEALREYIAKKGLEKGSPIMSEAQVCRKFSVSRVTVRKSFANLAKEGVLYKIKGKGTFVGANGSSIAKERPTVKSIAYGTPLESDSAYAMAILKGIESSAQKNGYSLSCFNSVNYISDGRDIDSLPEGILLKVAGVDKEIALIEKLTKSGRKVVFIDNPHQDFKLVTVRNNDLKGSRLIVNHLLELGHRRIAYISGPLRQYNMRERLWGYRSKLLDFGIKLDSNLILYPFEDSEKLLSEMSLDEFYELMESRIKGMLSRLMKRANPPTAIYIADAQIVINLFQATEALNLKIPDDLSLAYYGDSIACIPKLTTINQNATKIASRAFEVLRASMEGSVNFQEEEILLEPKLILGDSCRKQQE